MLLEDKIRTLHSLGIQARTLLEKPETEPRTSLIYLPSGKALVAFYSSCFSFISNNLAQITFEPELIDSYIEKARNEVDLLKSIANHPGSVMTSLKSKPDIVPFIICAGGMKRLYKVHLCKDHRKNVKTYKPSCSCYITWEDLDEGKDE